MFSKKETAVLNVLQTLPCSGYGQIAKEAGCTRRTTISAINLFVSLGVVTKQSKECHGGATNAYLLHPDRLQSVTCEQVQRARKGLKPPPKPVYCCLCDRQFPSRVEHDAHAYGEDSCGSRWREWHERYEKAQQMEQHACGSNPDEWFAWIAAHDYRFPSPEEWLAAHPKYAKQWPFDSESDWRQYKRWLNSFFPGWME